MPLNPRNKRLAIDIEQVKQWARAGATQQEIAQRLKIGHRTLKRFLSHSEYRDEYDAAVAELKISLRTKQVALALNGSAAMCIWLGKQLLGQKDRSEFGGPDGTPLLATLDAAIAKYRARSK